MAFYEVVKTFRVKQDGNSIELREGQIVSIPSGQEMQLLSTGRIKPCAEDERFQDTFSRVVGGMSREYKPGFFDRVRLQRPGKFSRFVACENRVSEYWDAGDFEGFQKELADWQGIYRSLLALFGGGNHG